MQLEFSVYTWKHEGGRKVVSVALRILIARNTFPLAEISCELPGTDLLRSHGRLCLSTGRALCQPIIEPTG